MDVLHEAFLDENGQSRIIGYWDQRDRTGPPPPGSALGTFHDRKAIAKYTAEKQVPPLLGRNHEHGTLVASIAAGRACGDFKGGVAPKAKILVVRTKTAVSAGDPNSIGYSVAHLEALKFIEEIADQEQLPVVVNLSQGQNAGAHDGMSLLETSFDKFSNGGQKPNRAIVKSAGNDHEKAIHAHISILPKSRGKFEWTSGGSQLVADTIEVWFSSQNECGFVLCDPDGEESPLVDARTPRITGEFPSGARYELRYTRFHPDNGDHLLGLTIWHDSVERLTPGRWVLKVTSDARTPGPTLHAWAERSNREFAFAIPDHEMTLSIPGTAHSVITVGATSIDGDILAEASFSAHGLTRDNRQKPDVVAPGVNILGAAAGSASGVVGAGSNNSGTSFAAPHITGLIAVAMSLRPGLNSVQLRGMLVASAGGPHNPGQGHGLVNSNEFFKLLPGAAAPRGSV